MLCHNTLTQPHMLLQVNIYSNIFYVEKYSQVQQVSGQSHHASAFPWCIMLKRKCAQNNGSAYPAGKFRRQIFYVFSTPNKKTLKYQRRFDVESTSKFQRPSKYWINVENARWVGLTLGEGLYKFTRGFWSSKFVL